MHTDERLNQIRERRSQNTGPSFGYTHELCEDIDFLLFLLDSQAALDCRPNMIAINREHAAVLMRDKCVRTIRDIPADTFGGIRQVEAIKRLKSVTLSEEVFGGSNELTTSE